MAATTTIPAYMSPSHTHSRSLSRSSHTRPSITPRGPAPSSSGKAMSPLPLPTPHAYKQQPTQQPRSSSPSYFEIHIDRDSDPPGSSAGRYARQNWENVSSQAQSVAPATRTAPVDANHEFDA